MFLLFQVDKTEKWTNYYSGFHSYSLLKVTKTINNVPADCLVMFWAFANITTIDICLINTRGYP